MLVGWFIPFLRRFTFSLGFVKEYYDESSQYYKVDIARSLPCGKRSDYHNDMADVI